MVAILTSTSPTLTNTKAATREFNGFSAEATKPFKLSAPVHHLRIPLKEKEQITPLPAFIKLLNYVIMVSSKITAST